MPTYTFVNTETEEQWDEFFTSYSAKDQFLAENPNIKQKLQPLGFIPQHGSALSKTPDSWKDHLKSVKRASGRNNTIKT